MLELQGARKHYIRPGSAVQAVDEVSIDVAAGEFVAIFGPSGSGKTTLLLLAAGLIRPDAGRVLFDGRDLAGMSKREALVHRRHNLGFVFQDFNLVAGMTAEENAALPLLLRGTPHRRARAHAREMLGEVGLSHRSRHTPAELAGGEQQRLAIARALIGGAKLILADEPTGNLDSETGDAVLDLLGALPRERGAAVALVSHDIRVGEYADRVLWMRDGRLVDCEPRTQSQAAVSS
jgi:putative ABC transport system ATP-binding protein